MLKRLHLKNFTVFADADFEFSPGLNVLVGTNGTGKSHVLKAGYVAEFYLLSEMRKRGNNPTARAEVNNPDSWFFSDKIKSVFQIVTANNADTLIRRGNQKTKAELDAEVSTPTWEAQISNQFIFNAPNLIPRYKLPSEIYDTDIFIGPVFIPAKEVLTTGWLLPLYDRREIPIDETYPDLLRLLMGPPLRQPEPAHIVAKLQSLIGGKVEEKGGRFYLTAPGQSRMEMNLVAEGTRKFATLYKLLANGTLTPKTTLFWDEPEANLNPALLRKLASILAELARQGFQIILATHSTDLLKEFHILSRQKDAKPLPIKYFGLNAEPGEATRIVTTDNFEYLPDVVALSEELKQADELEEIFIREDQEYHANNRGKE